ncbi:MAG: hypothetical protein KAX65_11400 [Caldilineaceae bacterium]|nr:hypothetical protein [Caldilineaceae bacterium]
MNRDELLEFVLDANNTKSAIIVAYARSIKDKTIPMDGYGSINSAIACRWSHPIMLAVKRSAWRLIDAGQV